MDYGSNIDDSVFLFEIFGKAIVQKPLKFVNNRTDIHTWDHDRDITKFTKNFVSGPTASPHMKLDIISIIQEYWDCFYSDGVRNPILSFEFSIDTGGSAPVCCPKPHYGPQKGVIIMEHIQVLLHNGWIRLCNGPWGSSIVLAAKPHQEQITDITNFIWHMCVSYRPSTPVLFHSNAPFLVVTTQLTTSAILPAASILSLWTTKQDTIRSQSSTVTRESSPFLDPTTKSTPSPLCHLAPAMLRLLHSDDGDFPR
jgi:hypothetical protein